MKKIIAPILVAVLALAAVSCHCKQNDTEFEDPNAGNEKVYGSNDKK